MVFGRDGIGKGQVAVSQRDTEVQLLGEIIFAEVLKFTQLRLQSESKEA
jgi:hypothetical protein